MALIGKVMLLNLLTAVSHLPYKCLLYTVSIHMPRALNIARTILYLNISFSI
jgi:hypothetical protein